MRKLIFIFIALSLAACTKENEKIIEVEKPVYSEFDLIRVSVPCNACFGGFDYIETTVDGEEVEIEYDTIETQMRFNLIIEAEILYKDSVIITQYRKPPGYPLTVLCQNKFYRNYE